jgi:hypothetical protein
MSDELYYTPSTLEERIARARARRAEEERAIVAMEAKELEVAAEAERLRNKAPLEVMTKTLTAFQASHVEKLELMERSVGALTTRVAAGERLGAAQSSLVEKLSTLERKVDALSTRVVAGERLSAAQSSFVEKLSTLERKVDALSIRDLEHSTVSPVTIAGIPSAIPVNVRSISIDCDQHGHGRPCTFDNNTRTFMATNYEPWSLEGFQRFKQCHTLHLFVTDTVKDFTPLGGMIALRTLTITAKGNGSGWYQLHPLLSDIRWISSLMELRQVSFLGCTMLTDITPLATLRNLQEVTLRQTGVHSTECIARLKVNKS